ncbi:hypothetical protein CTI12_AA370710 [Artemisia annua]|uniref:Ubiquitin-like protease family profile domain-containing protein n=1 Tax=Artemisia annua TaxID=35608 RepID=A0A2U1MKI8_ARTAN|nr:hypothetical protein CTI12_AA370710 [Artemisia annua]
MITPISFAPPSPEEKVTLNEAVDEDFTTLLNSFNTITQKVKILETAKNISEGEEGLENIREKRKVKPSESLKSLYFQRVVVMKNKVHDNEKKVVDTIFAARGDLDDVLFHSFFIDGQRIHFESFKEGNEVSAGVIDMWAYVLNQAEDKRSTGSLKKLYCHTSIISAEKRNLNSKANKSKFEEEMTSLLFLSPVYQSIRDVDQMLFPMMLADGHYYIVRFNLKEPQIHILDNMNHKDSIRNRYGKKFAHLRYLFIKFLKDNGYPHFKALGEYKDFDAGFVPEGKEQKKQIEDLRKKYLTKILLFEYNENKRVVESKIEEYHGLTLKEKRML